jgi:predicted CopG family antitoxin
MNYVTTNIRIPEDDYLRLKEEAAKKRKSLSAVIREKIKGKNAEKKASVLLAELDFLAQENSKHLGKWDSLKALRKIRTES